MTEAATGGPLKADLPPNANPAAVDAEAHSDSALSERKSTASAATIVMLASGFSALLGFGREIVTAHFFGTRSEVDAFLNASTVPVVLFGVLGGSLVGSLVPVLSEYNNSGREVEAKRLGSTVLNSLTIITACFAILGIFLAPFFVPIVAKGFPAEKQHLEIQMVRILMPGVVATTISGVCSAILNATYRFATSAFITVAGNIVTILTVLVLHQTLGILSLVIGTLIGLFAQALIQLPSMSRHGLYRFEIDLQHPGLRKVWALFFPVIAGSGAWQINLAFDRYFASTLSSGSTAALGYTTKLVFLPILVIAGAIATVIFPLIAAQFTLGNQLAMRRSVSLAVRMVGFLVIPCAVALIALAHPIIETLFERGAFTNTSTAICASLVPFACIPLIAISYNVVLSKVCYACKQMRLAVTSSFVVVALNIVLSSILIHRLGAQALLLANGLSMLVGTVLLFWLSWETTQGIDWKPIATSIGRVIFAAVAMGLALHLLCDEYLPLFSNEVARAFFLASAMILGGLLYLTLAKVSRSDEMTVLTSMILSKFASFGLNATEISNRGPRKAR